LPCAGRAAPRPPRARGAPRARRGGDPAVRDAGRAVRERPHRRRRAGRVRVDPLRVRQVIVNLLDNALRHTPAGSGVRLLVERPRSGVRITVEDSGPGFPDDVLVRAFEPFSRGPSSATGDGGAGLGLAIVMAVALIYGGSATAENLPGGGARVTVNLVG